MRGVPSLRRCCRSAVRVRALLLGCAHVSPCGPCASALQRPRRSTSRMSLSCQPSRRRLATVHRCRPPLQSFRPAPARAAALHHVRDTYTGPPPVIDCGPRVKHCHLRYTVLLLAAIGLSGCGTPVSTMNVPDLDRSQSLRTQDLRPASEKEVEIFGLMPTSEAYAIARVEDAALSPPAVRLLQHRAYQRLGARAQAADLKVYHHVVYRNEQSEMRRSATLGAVGDIAGGVRSGGGAFGAFVGSQSVTDRDGNLSSRIDAAQFSALTGAMSSSAAGIPRRRTPGAAACTSSSLRPSWRAGGYSRERYRRSVAARISRWPQRSTRRSSFTCRSAKGPRTNNLRIWPCPWIGMRCQARSAPRGEPHKRFATTQRAQDQRAKCSSYLRAGPNLTPAFVRCQVRVVITGSS
jgi:hypothetical protein